MGMSIDINPRSNPYIGEKGKVTPRGAHYDPSKPGTLHADHPIVKEFDRLGWDWGGDWETIKDYQHFEKKI
jgi:peptidoglycan LD-endopeptidase CwlK